MIFWELFPGESEVGVALRGRIRLVTVVFNIVNLLFGYNFTAFNQQLSISAKRNPAWASGSWLQRWRAKGCVKINRLRSSITTLSDIKVDSF
jgi:hypothetical protein